MGEQRPSGWLSPLSWPRRSVGECPLRRRGHFLLASSGKVVQPKIATVVLPGLSSRVSQAKVDGGSAFDGAFGPDFTTMSLNNSLHGGKANAVARELGARVEALKRLE